MKLTKLYGNLKEELPLYSDYAKQHKEDATAEDKSANEAEFKIDPKGFKIISNITGSLHAAVAAVANIQAKYFKKDRQLVKLLKDLRKAQRDVQHHIHKQLTAQQDEASIESLEAAFNQANRASTGADASGRGETEPGDHERGKAPEGQRWLKANPKNQY